ncbi:MAG: Stp1/IreP family PP2C-type Ser/Thr phosphatase [Chitinivibrionia bacterium]|nr:Stp1/IreP family PP2C-type Ser/Thr phosphatase [Chitinivibrionia bacterium]
MKFKAASLSHIGLFRETNEDSYCHFEPDDETLRRERGAMFIVADGMGGHQGGEVASRLAVEIIQEYYYASPSTDPLQVLKDAFQSANKTIFDASLEDAGLFGMGTTCTAMVLVGGSAYFMHIGDSRAYVCRNGGIEQLTRDHTLVEDMVRSGLLSSEDARFHPKKNVITKSLGTHEEAETDAPASPFSVKPGDVFLLCSDGLTSFVRDQEIKLFLESNEPEEAAKHLVDRANQLGGRDNITVQVVKVIEP